MEYDEEAENRLKDTRAKKRFEENSSDITSRPAPGFESNPTIIKYPNFNLRKPNIPPSQELSTRYKEISLSESRKKTLENQGFVVDVFESTPNILKAILKGHKIPNLDGDMISICEQLKNENYRFVVVGIQDTDLCESLSLMYQTGRNDGRPLNAQTIEKGKEVRVKNADDHALKVFEVFQNSKDLTNAKTLRGVAEILNKQGLPTARNKKWAPETLRGLYRRWEELGLKLDPKPE